MDRKFREMTAYYDKGLISKKGVYFHSPSAFARQNLFCPGWGAEFLCDVPYEIHRKTQAQFMDYYLIFRIMEGALHFDYEDEEFTAHPGDIVFLDSHIPNHYWASGKVRFQYIHFNGPLAKSYYELLHAQQGVHYTGRTESAFLFNNIIKEMAEQNSSDQKLSLWMYNLIAGIALPNREKANENVVRAQQYMQGNYPKSLTLDDIADHVGLSRFHFSRIFKQETGFSPHQYLINIRLRHAQELLTTKHVSLDDISLTCGFSSTSHFIYSFKKEKGVTPTMFRKYFDGSGFASRT